MKKTVKHVIISRYTIREEMRAGSVYSSLSIKTTDRSDSAVYTCVATNAFGSADTNINLIIQGEGPYCFLAYCKFIWIYFILMKKHFFFSYLPFPALMR